jgi:multidrug efflux system membrane fusion protein
VAAGTVVVVVRQMHPMEVTFTLPQDQLATVAARMRQGPVPALALVGSTRKSGVLSFLGGSVDPGTGTVTCKARFDNVDNALWPGSFVRVRLHIGDVLQAVVVPKAAVQSGPSGSFVFVVTPDDVAEMRTVALGPSSGGFVTIENGVSAGDRVVTDGQLAVVPGARVSIATASSTSPSRSISDHAPTDTPPRSSSDGKAPP